MKGRDRNNPCPCGSGKKLKKCCGAQSPGTLPTPFTPPPELAAQLAAERARRRRFGDVRPIIHSEWKGRKFVVVGSTLLWSDRWRTFPDFLSDYIRQVLGSDWGNTEIKKPLPDRHVIMQWYDALCRFQRSQTPGPNGTYDGVPDGRSMAYVTLAYDLYVLRDHHRLQDRSVRRLKHADQFQGARYELFVTATCIRAGFQIEFEDEGDTTQKHNEFIATHRPSGQQVVVEAKSRHRPGVMGRPGTLPEISELRVGVRHLLLEALEKPALVPRVVFIDLNYPTARGTLQDQPWMREVLEMIKNCVDGENGKCPWNCLVMTNHSYHYGADGEVYPPEHALLHFSDNPARPACHPACLEALVTAVQQAGTIPNTFPDDWGRST